MSNVNFEYVPNKFAFSTRCDIISNITSHVLYEYSVWVHMTKLVHNYRKGRGLPDTVITFSGKQVTGLRFEIL